MARHLDFAASPGPLCADLRAALVGRHDRAYVMAELTQAKSMSKDTAVAPVSPPFRPIVWAAAGAAGLLAAATIGLWAYFGSAVFYEMIAAGIAACF